jgi:hypothetical protein
MQLILKLLNLSEILHNRIPIGLENEVEILFVKSAISF